MMLPEWLRSSRQSHHRSLRSRRSSRNFSCSSFKDILNLFNDTPGTEPNSPKSPSILHRTGSPNLRTWTPLAAAGASPKSRPVVGLPLADKRCVVIYFTSLRIVRKTFEECRTVRSILRGYRVPVDERDLSMEAKFLDELQAIFGMKSVTLPRVFIGGIYVGGTEEVKEMHESGELRKLIGRLPAVDDAATVCDLCGGLRFVLCEQCNGSHKVYTGKSGFRTCTTCNVCGLVRCSSCSTAVHRRRISSYQ